MEKDLLFDENITKVGAVVLRALNNSFRQHVIKELHARKRSNVRDLYKTFKCDQSVMSQHLRILRYTNFVLTERNGKEIYYSVNYERFAEVDRLVKEILK